jgi:hypothetical protein
MLLVLDDYFKEIEEFVEFMPKQIPACIKHGCLFIT